ncbi:MAG: amidohydrolase family protein [Flavobacteriaceae bacterium]|jgi:imidazolonepropionase-like amidohydrolase|nr:amidohydrolase family protein [Flavobacteriaceae bacterium]MDG1385198.1 amidohydrolase family protein [Flavobacteriaceae bacterium]
MIKRLILLCSLLGAFTVFAQDYFPKNDGVKSKNTNFTAFTNAKIFVTPSKSIQNGTLLIQDGKVINVGTTLIIPKNTVIIDLKGKSIYPSFIDLYSDFGVSKPKRKTSSGRSPQYSASREGFYWNDHIRPEQNAIDQFKYDDKAAKTLLAAGFGVVNTHLQDGIVRGTGALIALDSKGSDSQRILSGQSAQYTSFSKSVRSRQSYPSSIMGGMALLRQLNYDANWYAQGNVNTKDRSIEAFNQNKNQVQIIEAGSRANALRADKVGDEIGVQFVILGGGDEYERINAIKNTKATFILPLNFPKAYDVENTFLTNSLELEAMKEWNQCPSNPMTLDSNGVPFAFTTKGLKSMKDFKTNLKKAIDYGLDKVTALEALTTQPAQILGNSKLGNLNAGSYANFLITSGDVFDTKTTLYENWVNGSRTIFEDISKKDIRGNYRFTIDKDTFNLKINGTLGTLKTEITSDSLKLSSSLKYKNDWMHLMFSSKDTTLQNYIRVNAKILSNIETISGTATVLNGDTQNLEIKRIDTSSKKDANTKAKKENQTPNVVPVSYPNGAYGFTKLPKAETLLFKNATVWTNESYGILENTDVLVQNGRISKIGINLSSSKAKVIDATGKHLTAGIVDEHSHIAAASINESGQNSSAEVSIEDVIDADDVDIYRNLAGGVTTIQILHGSANPIGGRSAIIKLKWGESAQNLIYKNSPKFIKFALGENVKQSNWESYSRFPQTRMGVEQLYIDYFSRAKAYDTKKKRGKPYRKDTEMEVLAEILNKKRFISCHSYIQSEINMLMKVAEKFDFNINTFTHILEGYKVADKMKAHGVGASTFSDWWAYKYEVNDAIPYNASILNTMGVITAINSDDAEMSRRLNQEAAKAVKYGGTSEEDAWKMVTLNPAKLLHIDDKVGSIKVGKNADLVLWSAHPLSIYAKAEKTIIEGVTYFDIDRDEKLRAAIQKERNELILMMLKEKNKGMKTQPIKKKDKHLLHCDSIDSNQL